MTYPLHVRVCERCLLAQLPPLITPEETFTEYAYFSSFSTSWVEHARRFVDGAVQRLGLGPESFVVEVASNDGYLLQHVVAAGHPLPGRRAVGERRRGGPGEGRPDADGVPHAGDRRPGAGRARARAARRAEQRLRAHPGRRRVHQGPAVAGRGRRLGVDRGAAPAHAGAAHPVRHDLPRALPVLHGAHRPAGARVGRPRAGRRRAARHPRRVGAAVGPPPASEVAGEPSQAVRTCWPRSRPPGCTPPRGTTGSPRRCPGCATTWSPS